MKELPKQTALIFETLSKGRFINANSTDSEQRELYTAIENNLEFLSSYFEPIGFQLEVGDGYYYFSRKEEKVGIERKINAAFRWIDMLDFFTTFHNGFAPGLQFYTTELQEQVRVNGLLRTKLQDMNAKSGGTSVRDQIEALLKTMDREGFIEKVDELDATWKVTAAFHYLQQMVLAIDIIEEEND